MTTEDYDIQIQALRDELPNAKGTACEVYTRIVGYYRNVENFNIGKKEEYKERKEYQVSAGA